MSISSLKMTLPMAELAEFCCHHGIRSLALFGSYLHSNPHLGSDMDLLVEYEPRQRGGLFATAEMESKLFNLLKRTADLRTAQDLSVYFRDSVLAEARVLLRTIWTIRQRYRTRQWTVPGCCCAG